MHKSDVNRALINQVTERIIGCAIKVHSEKSHSGSRRTIALLSKIAL